MLKPEEQLWPIVNDFCLQILSHCQEMGKYSYNTNDTETIIPLIVEM